MNSVRQSVVFIKEPQVTYSFSSQIMFYIMNTLICVGMILVDNILQCLLFIVVIDLSRTCDSTAILMCNALVMFIIYIWIKIKLKVLITIYYIWCLLPPDDTIWGHASIIVCWGHQKWDPVDNDFGWKRAMVCCKG
jgi:hypothetical protein